jgi:hypothetical protein
MAGSTIDGTRFQTVTLKHNDIIFVLDGVSSETQCYELLALLDAKLGSKVPMNLLNSRLKSKNTGRFLSMHETIEEVWRI